MKLLLRLIYIWLKKLTGVIYTNKPPSAIYYGFADLSKRQNHILKQVPNSLSRAKFDSVLDASGKPGDRLVLELFEQKRSLILNSSGRRNVFDINNNWRVDSCST